MQLRTWAHGGALNRTRNWPDVSNPLLLLLFLFMTYYWVIHKWISAVMSVHRETWLTVTTQRVHSQDGHMEATLRHSSLRRPCHLEAPQHPSVSCSSSSFPHSIYRLCGLVVRVSGYRSRGPEFDSRPYQIFWKVGGLERGALSLVITTEELLEKRSSGSGLENRD
jgi:hypothetical protein